MTQESDAAEAAFGVKPQPNTGTALEESIRRNAAELMDGALEARIAAADAQIAKLLAERIALMRSLANKRVARARPVRSDDEDKRRIVRRKAAAESAAISPVLLEEILGQLDREALRNVRALRFPSSIPDPKPVVIVGGRGGMGRLLDDHFRRSGWPVRILERNDWDHAESIFAGAGTVIVSVPIEATEAVIKAAAAKMPADALLCDVTSVKTGPVKAMLAAHKGPVAGLHPMFGPDVTDFRAQVFVHSPGRFESAAEPLLEQIRLWGGKVVRCSAEDHDRAMSIIQALRHFTTYAYGVFLSEIKPDLHRILSLSSPIYRLELLMVGRLFAQDPHLYCDIIMSDKEKSELIGAYVESLRPQLDIVRTLDREAFVKRFLQARAYFGELAPQFMKESGAILAKIQADRS